MTHQIDEVLDYVSPKSLNLQTHSLVKILNEVTSRITKSDTITINLPTNDIEVVCDSEKLEVVFVNLILNAIQAMENKGTISIRLAESVDKIIIEIEDTGPGISEDTLSKIFEPLFTTRQVGTGLGLPSCKSVVERHGGTIDVKTAVGKGTTFIIQLPKIKQ
jgi:signal transduction histidine kinase